MLESIFGGDDCWRFPVYGPNASIPIRSRKSMVRLFRIGWLAINVLGCFIIGVFAGLTRPDGGILVHPVIRQAVMIGNFGGFTTFWSLRSSNDVSPQQSGEIGRCGAEWRFVRCAVSGGGSSGLARSSPLRSSVDNAS